MTTTVSFDSIDKIRHYLRMLALEPLDDEPPPKYLGVSATFWRDYTCPPGCGGCCKAFSMDLWPDEYEYFKTVYPNMDFKPYEFEFFGQKETIFSNRETAMPRFLKPSIDYMGRKCEFLDFIGRCGIYKGRPFSCRFELNKISFDSKSGKALLSKRLFGRGWAYKRIDGGIGAKCEMVKLSHEIIEIVKERDLPLVERLVYLLDRYNIKHRGHALLDCLNQQYLDLKAGKEIKPITLVGEYNSNSLF